MIIRLLGAMLCLPVLASTATAEQLRRLPPHWSDAGLSYTNESRTTPRPLRIHVLRLDLASPRYEPVVVAAADPDADGPAEAALEMPDAMAGRAGLVAGVNATPFAGLPDAGGKRSDDWHAGMPVEILGWVVADARQRSGVQPGWANFWIDEEGRCRAASFERTKALNPPAQQAAGGFGMLVEAGTVGVGRDGPLQPRTAAGVDRDGQTLWLVVVDGRQPGFSQGMNEHEMGALMRDLGCHDAINLDGGGSSVMLKANPTAAAGTPLEIMNSPSGWGTRPVATILGIRRK